MAVVSCDFCKESKELSFYEHWICDCGAGWWGICLLEYNNREIEDALKFIKTIKSNYRSSANKYVVVLAKDLESPENTEGESLVDTLLLFFDGIIVPDFTIESFGKLFGDKKANIYRENDLIKCSDNSYVEALEYGLISENIPTSEYDFKLSDPNLEHTATAPNKSVRYSLFCLLQNMELVYVNQLSDLLKRTDLFNRNRIGNSSRIFLRGVEYLDSQLVWLIPSRFLRNEVFSYISGASFLCDQYYSIASTFRESIYTNAAPDSITEFQTFKEWLKTTSFQRRLLTPDVLFEFREKFGSLGKFIAEMRQEVLSIASKNVRASLIREFSSEMEKRINHYYKVMGKKHEKKAMYLSGLYSTLGALIGGQLGALIGGIGGTALSQLALEYDRQICPEICFIANSLVHENTNNG